MIAMLGVLDTICVVFLFSVCLFALLGRANKDDQKRREWIDREARLDELLGNSYAAKYPPLKGEDLGEPDGCPDFCCRAYNEDIH